METSRVIQLAGVIFCIVLIISEMCFCYPPSYYSSDEENVEQGLREMIEEWERQGLIRSLLPSKVYLPSSANTISSSSSGGIANGHEIITRKFPRSGSTSNLRLRYGKRNSVPRYEQMAMTGGARASSSNIGMGGLNEKVGSERD